MINEPSRENEITEFIKVMEKPKFTVRTYDNKKCKSFIIDISLIILLGIFIFQLPKILSAL